MRNKFDDIQDAMGRFGIYCALENKERNEFYCQQNGTRVDGYSSKVFSQLQQTSRSLSRQTATFQAVVMAVYTVAVHLILIIKSVSSSDLTDAIDSFQSELKTLFCDGLSVGGAECDGQYGIQNFINSFNGYFETGTENVTDLVNEIMDRVDNELNVRAGFLTTMAEAIDESCTSYGWGIQSDAESLIDFESLLFAGNAHRAANLPADMVYNELYEKEVSLTKSTYRLPNDVDYHDEHIMKDATISRMLEQTMVDLHEEFCVDELSPFVLLFIFITKHRIYCVVLVIGFISDLFF